MRIAIDEERTILTFDRDYSELIFKYNLRPHKGVIYLRLDTYQADESGKIIENLIHEMRLDFDNTWPFWTKTDFDKENIDEYNLNKPGLQSIRIIIPLPPPRQGLQI